MAKSRRMRVLRALSAKCSARVAGPPQINQSLLLPLPPHANVAKARRNREAAALYDLKRIDCQLAGTEASFG
jgi:hypothetical protein